MTLAIWPAGEFSAPTAAPPPMIFWRGEREAAAWQVPCTLALQVMISLVYEAPTDFHSLVMHTPALQVMSSRQMHEAPSYAK